MSNENEVLKKLEDIELALWEQNLLRKEMLTIDEAASYLDLTKSYLYKMAHFRILPYYCPNGKRIFFKRSELDQWLQRKRKVSREEMNTEAAKYLLKNRQL